MKFHVSVSCGVEQNDNFTAHWAIKHPKGQGGRVVWTILRLNFDAHERPLNIKFLTKNFTKVRFSSE